MSSLNPATPAFGEATLSNCEREQIHLAGCIQPHGALLAIRETDQIILQSSANFSAFVRFDRDPIGLSLRDLGGDLWLRAREMPDDPNLIPYLSPCRLADLARPLNALLHRAEGGEVVIEIEDAGPTIDFSPDIESALQSITNASSIASLCDVSARIFKDIAGYDRVMIYRFDEDGHGEVFAETRRPELEAFLGNRYPASDIPQIARRLYVKNRVRLLGDVNHAPSPVTPRLSPLTGDELDMSLCYLRSASPIHIQYLKNMGVSATLVVSLMVGEKLWGLVSCHHYSPRFLFFELRSVCELISEAIGTRIAALESFAHGQCQFAARRLEQRMLENISRDGDWRGALFDSARSLLLPLGAGGAALLYEGQIQTTGEAPGANRIRSVAAWLANRMADGFYATNALASEAPEFADIVGVSAGIAAARVSGDGEELLVWFRPERVRTITWGGKPFKSPSDDDDPSELSPRRSFAQWHQVVEGTSDPWTPTDIATAKLIGAAVMDVVLQFRAIQLVIAKDQLNQVSRRVRAAKQLVIVADSRGQILETSGALVTLLGDRRQTIRHLDELADFFAGSEDFAARLRALRYDCRSLRGEVSVKTGDSAGLALRLRADPVAAPSECALGFVLLFSDLTEQREVEAARQSFQEGVIASRRRLSSPLQTRQDLRIRNLLQQIVDNARLAALEVTDAADPAKVRGLLEGINESVKRSAEVLERFVTRPPTRAPSQTRRRLGRGAAASGDGRLHEKLRAATRAAHERMHRHDGFLAAVEGRLDAPAYVDLLARLYGFYRPFESHFATAPAAMAEAIDLAKRTRTPRLRDDLLALGFAGRFERLPVCDGLPAPDAEPAWLGALYVTEGSALGGAKIARALVKSGFHRDQVRFFAGHGKANASMWASFLARLDSLAADPRSEDAAEASAIAMFTAFECWMKDWRGSASA
ncbi:biliverdin-producing heme oxygenase [uncultured Rhodoblastus sp.]|uniref:biliverdin-producing heme oxygenase n=1 Tax=uncultured Rhodoblastus sp. TaxID=543037 RepID=UPI0025CDB8EC|nr:biliverdin-producing heme oxygenase [uncultured Rhodoblastus sp.]